MARGLFAVMEDELADATPAPTTEQTEQIEQLEGEVAQGEVVQAEGEVVGASEVVDQATAAIEELADISGIMADSIEKGDGFGEDTAEVAKVAVEAICARLNYKPAKKLLPAMESFGSTSSRLEATKYAMETVMDTIRTIWEAIKNFFKGLWDKVVAFWKRLFDAATKLKARAENVQKKATEIADKNMVVDAEKKIDVTKFCGAFEVKSAAEVLNAANDTIAVHDGIVKSVITVNELAEKSLEAVAKIKTTEEMNKLVEDVLVNVAVGATKGLTKTKSDGGADFFKGLGFNNIVKEEVGEKDTITVSIINLESKVEKVDTVTGAELAGIRALTGNVKSYAENLLKAKGAVSKSESFMKSAIKLADSLSKSTDKPDLAKSQAKVFRDISNIQNIVTTRFTSIGIQVGSAALSYVEANLGTYKAA